MFRQTARRLTPRFCHRQLYRRLGGFLLVAVASAPVARRNRLTGNKPDRNEWEE